MLMVCVAGGRAEMEPSEQLAAGRLGWDEEKWEEGESTAACETRWEAMTEVCACVPCAQRYLPSVRLAVCSGGGADGRCCSCEWLGGRRNELRPPP